MPCRAVQLDRRTLSGPCFSLLAISAHPHILLRCVSCSLAACAQLSVQMQHRVCQRTTSSCFNEAGLPLSALPFTELKKNDKVVYRIPYTNEDGALVEEFWYGVVTLICASREPPLRRPVFRCVFCCL